VTELGEGVQIGTIQDDVEEFHWLEVHYCYPGGLPVEGTYLATDSDGLQHRGSLNDLGGLCLNYLPAGQVDVEFIPPEDSDTLDTLHKTIKDVLNEILAEKQAETEQTEARLEGMSALEQGGSLLASARRGFWNGAVGLIEFVGDTLVTVANIAVYLSPIERLNNLLEASYKSYQSGDLTEGKWRQSLLDNMKQEELEDLSRLLGFDPSTIDLTRITEAYEITALIATDDATLAILKNFAKDYVGAQSSLDWAEFAGGGVFEIVLAALLIAFTGGAGLVVQAGSKIRHVSRLRKLGGLLSRLGKVLKRKQLNKKIKVGVDKKTTVEAERLEGPKLTSGKPGKREDDAAEPSVVPNKLSNSQMLELGQEKAKAHAKHVNENWDELKPSQGARKPSTVDVIVTRDGKVFEGYNTKKGHPNYEDPLSKVDDEIKDAYDSVPIGERMDNSHGFCAEVSALQKAKCAGADLDGAVSVSAEVKTGKLIKACDSCNPALESLGVVDGVRLM